MKTLGYGSMLAVCLVVFCLAGSCNKAAKNTGTTSTSSSGGPALVAPSAFSFKTLAGATETSSKYLGKPLVVNFWADW